MSLSNLVLSQPELECLTTVKPLSGDAVRRQVWEVLSGVYPPGHHAERRYAQRFPYPHLLYLTPLEADGVTPQAQSVAVVGKHLSECGLGFYYQQQALPHRRMIASLEVSRDCWRGFLLDIVWCRFTRHGWYDSGGRFLQVVQSPIDR